MAQVAIPLPQAWGLVAGLAAVSAPSLSDEEQRQMLECEKIVNFRDEILAGLHPRIKIPPSQLSTNKPTNGASVVQSSTNGVAPLHAPTGPAAERRFAADRADTTAAALNAASFYANHKQPVPTNQSRTNVPGLADASLGGSDQQVAADNGPREPTTQGSTSRFDPVLLQKSGNLIAAEIQSQRKRLEKKLRDEYEQQQSTKKSHGSDPQPDLDLHAVLLQALARVQAAPPAQTNAETTANAGNAASPDSFDDNTFYSSSVDSHPSRRDAPEQPQILAEDVQMRDESDYEPPDVIGDTLPPSTQQAERNSPRPFHVQPSSSTSRPLPIPTIKSYPQPSGTYYHSANGNIQGNAGAAVELSSGESREGSRPERSVPRQEPVASVLNSGQLDQQSGARHAPFVVDDVPSEAPQLLHAPRPAAAQGSVVPTIVRLQESGPSGRATPNQISSLRNAVEVVSSPNDATQSKDSRKAKKKNKRKSDRHVEATSLLIKPEPRSPSPISAPQFARLSKRARQGQETVEVIRYEPALREAPEPMQPPQQEYPVRVYRAAPEPREIVYDSRDGQYSQPTSRPILVEEDRYAISPVYGARHVQEALPPRRLGAVEQPEQYASGSRRVVSSSQIPPDRSYREATVRYADPYATQAVVERPGPDRLRERSLSPRARVPSVMGPPRAQTTRIVVDEYGREYIEPAPVAAAPRPVVRYSVAPTRHYDEPETAYVRREAPVMRAVSVVPGAQPAPQGYERRMVYGDGTPVHAQPRRVVTQPTYAQPEARQYREREYSVQPREHVVEYQRPQVVSERPVEYVRAGSVRPGAPVAYEQPQEYAQSARMQSVAPTAMMPPPPRAVEQYVVRGESRQMTQAPPLQHQQRYSVMPMEAPPPVTHRAYSVAPQQPPTAYYTPQPAAGHGGEQVTYVQRRAEPGQDVVYQSYERRDVYQ